MERVFRQPRLISLIVLIAASASMPTHCPGAITQDEKQAKPYQEWSKQQVTKVLNDSPWAKTQVIRITPKKQLRSVAGQVSATPSSADANGHAALGGAEEPINYSFTIRLRSSLPIRQAIARLVEIESNYDGLQPAQKRALNAQTRELLKCKECADNYVISVGFGSTNSPGVDLIYDWFRGQSVESLKGYIYIQNDRGERRELASFIPPRVAGDEAFFLFTRMDKGGKPLITANNKRLLFRMSDAHANSVTNFSLDVSRMVVNGKVEF